jgi:hypothetical protein
MTPLYSFTDARCDSQRALDEYRANKIIKRWYPVIMAAAIATFPLWGLWMLAKHPASIGLAVALPIISTNAFV